MSNATATPKVTKRHRRIAKRAVSKMPAEKGLSAEDAALLAALLGSSMAEDIPEDGDDDEGGDDDVAGDPLAGLSEDAADDTIGQLGGDRDAL